MAIQPYSLNDENTAARETALRVFRASFDRLRRKARSLSDHYTRRSHYEDRHKNWEVLEMAA
jgi:hypothetical protein